MQQIWQRHQGYLGMAQADLARLDEKDVQTGELENKPSSLPTKRFKYQQ